MDHGAGYCRIILLTGTLARRYHSHHRSRLARQAANMLVLSRQKPADEIDALLKRKEQLDQRLRAAHERHKEHQRLDNEDASCVGTAVLEFMLANPDSPLVSNLREILDRQIIRPADRALLPALPASDNKAESNGPKAEKS